MVVASIDIDVPGDNKRELTSKILHDLGIILVKHFSKFDRGIQEAKKRQKL